MDRTATQARTKLLPCEPAWDAARYTAYVQEVVAGMSFEEIGALMRERGVSIDELVPALVRAGLQGRITRKR